jgi:ubiquinone/menaquinone biosynthesis C-methylase UbiE
MSRRDEWENQAGVWIEWVTQPNADPHWTWARPVLLDLLPAPGALTLDIGCGAGRLSRELSALGHAVVGVDFAPALIRRAQELAPELPFVEADAAALPLTTGSADLAIAYMSLMEMDDLDAVVTEAARVLIPGGVFAFVVVHPMDSAAAIPAPYSVERPYEDAAGRLTLRNVHRPAEAYFRALERAGLVVEAVREPSIPAAADVPAYWERWKRVPLALVVRARRTSG